VLTVLIDRDDGLDGARCNVIIGAEVEFVETSIYLEGFGDSLLVGFAAIATTHDLSVSLQNTKLAANKPLCSKRLAHSVQDTGELAVDSYWR
jgi:hypothetical protein